MDRSNRRLVYYDFLNMTVTALSSWLSTLKVFLHWWIPLLGPCVWPLNPGKVLCLISLSLSLSLTLYVRFLLHLAEKTDGIIVTNDNLRDFVDTSDTWRKIIQERWLCVLCTQLSESFSWIFHYLMWYWENPLRQLDDTCWGCHFLFTGGQNKKHCLTSNV